MKNIVYLFGSGATTGELQFRHKYEDNPTSVGNIAKSVIAKSREKQRDFYKIVDTLEIGDNELLDIEIIISLFEFGQVKKEKFKLLANELRLFYREYLIEQTCNDIQPLLTKILLKTHKDYSKEFGDSGERLLGIITTNYDDLIEKAFCDKETYEGLNYSYPFESNKYKCNVTAPFLLKLHGSFNWRIQGKELSVVDIDPTKDNPTGWVPPSIFKNPENDYVFESIWDQAEYFLKNCDILRVIGGNLRNEDFGLLGLLFRCQQACYDRGGTPFSIQLIIPLKSAEQIRKRLPFLTSFSKIDEVISPKNLESYRNQKVPNAYHIWINDLIEKISYQNEAILKEQLFLEMEGLK